MAQVIMLRHPGTGLTTKGYVGFSWTSLFFTSWPALFRADYMTFVCASFILWWLGIIAMGIAIFGGTAIALATGSGGAGGLLAFLVAGIPTLVWAFKYNGYHMRKLMERGYLLADVPARNALAQQKLGISAPTVSAAPAQ
jgi:hypothetical protein